MKRVDIKTGYICNNNCRFCVQAHNKHAGNRTTEEVKKDIDESFETGCRGIVFTGGEVTLRKDIFDLVSYAKKKGFGSIQMQSNHRLLSYMDYCKQLIAAGANEFAPALHGHKAEVHDYLTEARGSFDQTLKAIKNLKSLGQYVITNTVVVRPNYRHMPDLARLFVCEGVDQYQFAFMHAVGNGLKNFDSMMPYMTIAAPYIKQGLQIGIDNNVKVMAEALPFCVMQGYEKYCSEWYMPDTEIRELGKVDPDFKKTRLSQGKAKFPQCASCIHDNVCEGPWREYPERYGESEFVPVRA